MLVQEYCSRSSDRRPEDTAVQLLDRRLTYGQLESLSNRIGRVLRDAGCRCIQIEEPTLHFMANTFGAKHEKVKFMVECYNREVQGLDDVEIWIHTCWGNPNMQRVIEDDSYAASLEMYLNGVSPMPAQPSLSIGGLVGAGVNVARRIVGI